MVAAGAAYVLTQPASPKRDSSTSQATSLDLQPALYGFLRIESAQLMINNYPPPPPCSGSCPPPGNPASNFFGIIVRNLGPQGISNLQFELGNSTTFSDQTALCSRRILLWRFGRTRLRRLQLCALDHKRSLDQRDILHSQG